MRLRQDLATTVSRVSREQKVRWLTGLIPPSSRVLLVGVGPTGSGPVGTGNLVERALVRHADAHAMVHWDVPDPQLGCDWDRGDACDLPYPDNSFDFVVSNAVIEHVGGVPRAQRMLAEAKRVARAGSIHTTPYRWFPIETHTQVPFLHWLPRGSKVHDAAFARMGKGHFTADKYWLFGRRSLAALDPSYEVRQLSILSIAAVWMAPR